ncbi:ABC transporter substrate-binding protein [Lachnoclostridium pacaense]|uniref:ABC transporter substrate-binding protein n=1 Tax=Enterocloster hominis (ex Hitch et al. 2024) TaxID=1917870 RepID=UPI001D125357|nr:ABC transporter substrate-binding protein [Lachnoclostridium pacaense]MCC2876806.1 ABC transporter substrate-binding protein [Lachnoclostridium pacaense]
MRTGKIITTTMIICLLMAAACGCAAPGRETGAQQQAAGPQQAAGTQPGQQQAAGPQPDQQAAGPQPGSQQTAHPQPSKDSWDDREVIRSMELLYADQFSVDYYDDGCAMISIRDSGRFLVVPEQGTQPEGLPEDVTVLRQPVKNIYLVATSAMDLFKSLDAMDRITLSGTDAQGWYIEEARQALEDGGMFYAGKYNAPDYELILSKSCGLAIESTMISHSPEVKEQLEQLGIPVLVERSSYESHPLGRMEWLKLYGVLTGREEQAEACFRKQMENLKPVLDQDATEKTVAFFYISSNGYVNVRKSGDYVAKMIELAGGTYVPEGLDGNGNALSTMNMQMEAFYAAAKEADYIIYNSTIDGELESLAQLLDKSSLLADFKAVKEGNVWCTEKSLFQETMGLGNMILDIHRILTEEAPDQEEMAYMHRLR